MRTRSKIAAMLLAFLSAAAARGEDGVIFVCPTFILLTPTQIPAGWTVPIIANQPFKDAGITDGKIWCGYAEPNAKNAEAGVISRPVPAGMGCAVNASNPRQFDCLPQTKPSVMTRAKSMNKVATPSQPR